ILRVSAGPSDRLLSAFPAPAGGVARRGQGPDRECLPAARADRRVAGRQNICGTGSYPTCQEGPTTDGDRAFLGCSYCSAFWRFSATLAAARADAASASFFAALRWA